MTPRTTSLTLTIAAASAINASAGPGPRLRLPDLPEKQVPFALLIDRDGNVAHADDHLRGEKLLAWAESLLPTASTEDLRGQ